MDTQNKTLQNLTTKEETDNLIKSSEYVIICCGRDGPVSRCVYDAMSELQDDYPDVKLRRMDFDLPSAKFIRDLPQFKEFKSLPFIVFFKNGKIVNTARNNQTKNILAKLIKSEFNV